MATICGSIKDNLVAIKAQAAAERKRVLQFAVGQVGGQCETAGVSPAPPQGSEVHCEQPRLTDALDSSTASA